MDNFKGLYNTIDQNEIRFFLEAENMLGEWKKRQKKGFDRIIFFTTNDKKFYCCVKEVSDEKDSQMILLMVDNNNKRHKKMLNETVRDVVGEDAYDDSQTFKKPEPRN